MRRKVHFRADPVQSRSRLLRNRELHFLQDFENHVRERLGCQEALETSTLGSTCSYCRDTVSYIMSKFGCHHGDYVEKSGDDNTLTFVEIPKDLTASRRILNLAKKRDHRRSKYSSASIPSTNSLHYYGRSEETAGSYLSVTSYRILARSELGQRSTCYTEVWREENPWHSFLGRTTVSTSAMRECLPHVLRRPNR